MKFEQLDIQCEPGMVLDANASQFGVISNEFKFFGYCTEKQLDKKIAENEYQSCSRHMDRQVVDRIKADMYKRCDKTDSCLIDFKGIMNPADNAMN
jgi:hypothetical protein